MFYRLGKNPKNAMLARDSCFNIVSFLVDCDLDQDQQICFCFFRDLRSNGLKTLTNNMFRGMQSLKSL